MNRNPKTAPLVPIDHSKIIDGFDELGGHINYLPFSTSCGICNVPIDIIPSVQKYVLEVKRVPVKHVRTGALYCDTCKERRSRINFLKKGDKYNDVKNGLSELRCLQLEENQLNAQPGGKRGKYSWPY